MPCFSLANEQNPRIDSIFAKFIAQPQATIIEEQTGSFNAPQNVDEKAEVLTPKDQTENNKEDEEEEEEDVETEEEEDEECAFLSLSNYLTH